MGVNVGAHVSSAGGLTSAIDRQIDAGGTCGQVFTGAPVVWDVPERAPADLEAFARMADRADLDPWVIHAPYLINLASPDDELYDRSVERLQTDLDVAARIGATFVNVHLGAHTGSGEVAGLERVVDALRTLRYPDGVRLVLETDPGAGTKLGNRFEQFAAVLERVDRPIGVCFDTAHVHVAGYDLATRDAVEQTVDRFDDVVGLERLALVHLNDPVYECGSRRDEHAHIGDGTIGRNGIRSVLDRLSDRSLPFVLETPVDEERDDAWNIEQVKGLRTR